MVFSLSHQRVFIRKYGLDLCRQCFHEKSVATEFVKVRFRPRPRLVTVGMAHARAFCYRTGEDAPLAQLLFSPVCYHDVRLVCRYGCVNEAL